MNAHVAARALRDEALQDDLDNLAHVVRRLIKLTSEAQDVRTGAELVAILGEIRGDAECIDVLRSEIEHQARSAIR